MLTDRCKITIDEALMAGSDSQLSAEAIAHIESCLACRRSLKTIKGLSASVESVLLAEKDLALKQSIAARLAPVMQANKTATGKVAKTKVLASNKAVAHLLLALGTAVTFGCGLAYYLSSSSPNMAAIKDEQHMSPAIIQPKTEAQDTTKSEGSQKQSNNYKNKGDKEIFEDGYDGDLRDPEKKELKYQVIPSPIEDSDSCYLLDDKRNKK